MTSVGIVGLGTVGHALALSMLAAGHRVVGIDLSPQRRSQLVSSASDRSVASALTVGAEPVAAEFHIIAVNTPLDVSGGEADLSFLVSASRAVGRVLRAGDVVIVRSTVPVGTVRGSVAHELSAASGLSAREFHLSYAPERCVVGDEARELATLPQLVGATDAAAASRVRDLFEGVTGEVIVMQAIEAAELAKLSHNAYNDLRHAFSNQVGMIAQRYNLDAVRLIDDANRDYPRDPMVRPSPGVGGSCLTKDPYLLAQALEDPSGPNLFTMSREVNDRAVTDIIRSAVRFAVETGRPTRLLLCGAAFKAHPPTSDTRGSVGVRVAQELAAMGLNVVVHDPCVSDGQLRALGLSPHENLFDGTQFDIALLLSDHTDYQDQLRGSNVRHLLAAFSLVYDPWKLVDVESLRRDAPDVVYAAIGIRSVPETTLVTRG